MVNGPIPAQKITLRCKNCNLNYHYDMFCGESMGGYKHYDISRDFVAASNVCFIEQGLCEQWISAGYAYCYQYVMYNPFIIVITAGWVLKAQLKYTMKLWEKQRT